MFDFLASMLKIAQIPFTENEALAPKSTFKVGGTARLFITPQTPEQLESTISAVRSAELPYFVTGGASNVVYPDGIFEGAIISTQGIKEIIYNPDETTSDGSVLVTCQCGVPMAAFVDFCTRKNLNVKIIVIVISKISVTWYCIGICKLYWLQTVCYK